MSAPIIIKSLSVEKKYPYFFKNKLIDDNTYIAQQAQSVEHALHIIDVWNRERYNVGEVDQKVDIDIPHNKYFYNGNDDITKVEIDGGDDDVKVIVYKKDGIIHTVALLKFTL